LRVVDLTGGIIHEHQQVIPALVVEPAMLAAIDVQHHSWQGPPLSPLPVFAALASRLDQTRTLQRLLHPGVTQADVMLTAQLLVKVPHVKVKVLLLV
jgi:hypothetical protein